MRRTKIVATLGPASSSPEVVRRLIESGMDVARLNFSHGNHEEHCHRIRMVREIAEGMGRGVACFQDLAGPKIRTGRLESPAGVTLKTGAHFALTTEDVAGTAERVSTTYGGLVKDARLGHQILLDDGLIELEVLETTATEVRTRVVSGGQLKSNKGINLPGIPLSIPALTDKDQRDVELGLEMDVDFVALSFVRRKEDIEELRAFLSERGRADVPIVAKIEKPSAIDNLDSILEVADGVMVARGDMGVELPEEKVPILQKEIIRQANQRGRVVITATQMLESMVEHPRPTRAEASDVANAILDGTDAVMLSAETASGRYPVEALATMARIAEYTETHIGQSPVRRDADSPSPDGSAVTRAVASASCRAAEELSARYVMAFTESGATVRTVSQSRPRPPILGFTPSERVYRRLALRWGVTPVRAGRYDTTDKMLDAAIQFLTGRGLVDPGDVVVVVCGTTTLSGATNMMKILKF